MLERTLIQATKFRRAGFDRHVDLYWSGRRLPSWPRRCIAIGRLQLVSCEEIATAHGAAKVDEVPQS